ncbi:restriction endonuclease subunit S, partial [Staphylococcus epidermidis]
KWFDINSDIGWLRIADVTEQNGKINFLEQRLSKEGQSKTRVLKFTHLLLSIAASVGKPVINFVKTGVHDGFLIFLNPQFNIYYMYNWLDFFKKVWNKYGQPGSQVNLNSDNVKSQEIRIPHINEQNKIADFLESIDKLVIKQSNKVELLKQRKKGLLQKMFV